MSFYFVRHGESEANKNRLFSSPSTPLTGKGCRQAKEIGLSLSDKKVTRIITSPDLRARQTSKIVAECIGYNEDKILVVDELHERRFGKLAGTPRKQNPHYSYVFDRDGDAETRGQLIERIKVAIKKLKEFSDLEGDVLIVGHTVSGYYLRELLQDQEAQAGFSSDYLLETRALFNFPAIFRRPLVIVKVLT